MIEICKLQESYKAKKILDDDMAIRFVEAVEHGLSIDGVLEIMCGNSKSKTIEFETKRLLNSKIIRSNPICCAALGVRCIQQGAEL